MSLSRDQRPLRKGLRPLSCTARSHQCLGVFVHPTSTIRQQSPAAVNPLAASAFVLGHAPWHCRGLTASYRWFVQNVAQVGTGDHLLSWPFCLTQGRRFLQPERSSLLRTSHRAERPQLLRTQTLGFCSVGMQIQWVGPAGVCAISDSVGPARFVCKLVPPPLTALHCILGQAQSSSVPHSGQ